MRTKELSVRPMKQLLIPLLCASLVVPALSVPQAGATPLPQAGIGSSAGIVLVDRHGHMAATTAAAGDLPASSARIIAGTMIAAAIREHRARPSDMEACDRDFPDFDPRDRNLHRPPRPRARLPLPALTSE